MGTLRLVVDGPHQAVPEEVSVARLGDLLADREARLWLDISDPGPEEVALLRRAFSFHELALEEVTKPHERPRCDACGRGGIPADHGSLGLHSLPHAALAVSRHEFPVRLHPSVVTALRGFVVPAGHPEAVGVWEHRLDDVERLVFEKPSHRPGEPVARVIGRDDFHRAVRLEA